MGCGSSSDIDAKTVFLEASRLPFGGTTHAASGRLQGLVFNRCYKPPPSPATPPLGAHADLLAASMSQASLSTSRDEAGCSTHAAHNRSTGADPNTEGGDMRRVSPRSLRRHKKQAHQQQMAAYKLMLKNVSKEELLAKVIEMEPTYAEAWSMLGECIQQRGGKEALTPVYLPSVFSEMITFCPGTVQASIPLPLMKKAREVAAERATKDKHREDTSSMYEEGRDRPQELLMDGVGGRGLGEGGSGNHSHSPPRSVTRGGPSVPVSPNASLTSASFPVTPSSSRSAQIQARERPSPPPALASGHRVSPPLGALPPAARAVDASEAGPGQAYHSAEHQTSISPPPGAAGESVASSSIGLAHLRGVNTSGAFAAAADVDGSGAPYVLTDLSSRGAAAGNDGTHTAGNGSFGARSFDKESNGRQSPGLAISGAVPVVSQADASPNGGVSNGVPSSAVVNAPSAESIPSPDPADYEHMILYQIATIFTVLHEHDTTLRIEEEEELITAGLLRPEDASFDCNTGDRADEPTCSGSGLRRAQSAREHRQSGQSMAAAAAVNNGNTTANAPPLSSRRSSTARGGSRPTPPSMPSTKAAHGKHLQGLGVLFDNFIFVDRVICAAKAYLLQPHNTAYQLKLAVALLEDRVLYQPRDHPIPPSPREAVLICQRLLTALAEATPFDAVVWHWLGRTLRHDQVVHLAVPPIPRSILCGEIDASPSILNGAKSQDGDGGASRKTNGGDDQTTVEQLLFARRSCLVRSIEVDTTGSLPTNYDVLAAEMAPGEMVELPRCPKRRDTHRNNGSREAPASYPRTRTPGRSESPGHLTIHSGGGGGDDLDHMDEQAQLRAALYGSFDDQQVQLLGLQLDSRTAMGWVTLGATLDDEEAIDVSLPSGEVVCMNQTQCFLMSVAQEPSYQAWWNLALSCGVLREPRSTFDAPANGENAADTKTQNDERSLADETNGATTLNPTCAFAENDDDDDGDAIAHESTECQRLTPNLTTTVSEGLAGTKPGRDVSVADIVVSDRMSNNDNNENASSMDSYGLPPEELTMAIHRLRELDDELLISPKSAKPNAGLLSQPSDPNASPHDGRGQQQRLMHGAPTGAGHGLGSSTTSINVDGGVAAGRGIRSRRASTVSVSAAGGVQGLPGFTTVVNTSVASTGAAKTDRSALSLHRRMSSSLSAIGGGPSLGTSAAVPLSQLSIATSTGGGGGAGQDRRFQSSVEASAARSAVANTTAGGGGGGRYFSGSNSGVDDDLGGLAIASVAATPLAGRRATLSPPPPFGHPGQSVQGGERGANGHLSTTPPLVDMVSPTGGAEPSEQRGGKTSDTSKAAGAATGDATAVFSQSNTAPPMSDAGQSPLQVPSASTHSVAPPPLSIGAAGLGAPNGEPAIPVSVSSPDYGRVRPAHAQSPPRPTVEASGQQRHDTSTTPTPKHATRDSSNHNHYLRGNESPSRQSMSPSPSRQPTSGTGHVGQCRSRSVSPPPGSVSVARSGGAFSNNSSFQRPTAIHPQIHPLVPNLSLGHAGGPRGSFGVSATPEGLSLPSSSRSRRFGAGGGANANNNNQTLLHHVGSGLSAASLGGVSGGGHAAAFVGTSPPPTGIGNGSGELASLLGKQLVSRPGSSRAMTGRGGPGAARDSGTGALGVVRSSMVSAIAMGDAPWSSVDAGEFDAGAAFAHNRGVLLDVCVKGQLELLSDEGTAGDGADDDAAAATRDDDLSEANAGQKKGTISNEKDQQLQQGRQRILAPVLLRQSFGDDRPGFTQLECLIYALECDNGQAEAWRALGHVLLSFQAVRKGARSDALFAAEPHGPALDPTSLAAATKSSTAVDDRQAQHRDRYPSQLPDAGGGDAQANGQTAQSMIHRVNGGNDKDALRSVSDVGGIGGGAGIGSPNHQSMAHAASSTTTTTAAKKVPETAIVEEVLMVHVGCEAVDADICFAKAATLQNHPMR